MDLIEGRQYKLSMKFDQFERDGTKRIRAPFLDFKGISAARGANAIHSYPAMFHPYLVNHFIENLTKKGDSILDPFVGSGVSAVEAAVAERKFIGFDINPLALLIAQVRTTPLNSKILNAHLREIMSKIKKIKAYPIDFPNIDFWFSPSRISSLSKIMTAIGEIDDEEIHRFFKVALSETIRTVSRTKPNEFKLVKRDRPCLHSTRDTFGKFATKNIKALSQYYKYHEVCPQPVLDYINVYTDNLPVKDETISLLLTSPPYGDSQTTVAYGQFSRLSLQWLNLPYNVDKTSLGAKGTEIDYSLPSRSLYQSLKLIQGKDIKRAMQVFSFYKELYMCFSKLVPKVKNGGHLVIVVGNRTVKDIQLPTDEITAEFLEALGCYHSQTMVRAIGNKRMPAQNSPSNIKGKKSPTMKYEYMVICQKNRPSANDVG